MFIISYCFCQSSVFFSCLDDFMLYPGFLETKFKQSFCPLEIPSEKFFHFSPFLSVVIKMVILSKPHPRMVGLTLSMIITSVYRILHLMHKPSYFKNFSGQVKPIFPSYSPACSGHCYYQKSVQKTLHSNDKVSRFIGDGAQVKYLKKPRVQLKNYVFNH